MEMPTSSLSSHRPGKSSLRAFLKAVRVMALPPRNAAFIKGRPYTVEPDVAGPTGAIYNGKTMPAWWLLKCGRLAEFVGIHDDRQTRNLHAPVGEAETIIDGHGIYRITEKPLSLPERQALQDAALRSTQAACSTPRSMNS